MGGGRFETITFTIMIIALLLLPTLPSASAPSDDDQPSWIRGIAVRVEYQTHPLEPGRLTLVANVTTSLPIDELAFTWTIENETVRNGQHIEHTFHIPFKETKHVAVEVCHDDTCANDETHITLINWLLIIGVSVFFCILIIGVAMFEEKWRKGRKS
jgi:hypothetical protein